MNPKKNPYSYIQNMFVISGVCLLFQVQNLVYIIHHLLIASLTLLGNENTINSFMLFRFITFLTFQFFHLMAYWLYFLFLNF